MLWFTGAVVVFGGDGGADGDGDGGGSDGSGVEARGLGGDDGGDGDGISGSGPSCLVSKGSADVSCGLARDTASLYPFFHCLDSVAGLSRLPVHLSSVSGLSFSSQTKPLVRFLFFLLHIFYNSCIPSLSPPDRQSTIFSLISFTLPLIRAPFSLPVSCRLTHPLFPPPPHTRPPPRALPLPRHAYTPDASRECLHEHICKSAFGFTGKVTLVLSSVRLVLSAPKGCSV